MLGTQNAFLSCRQREERVEWKAGPLGTAGRLYTPPRETAFAANSGGIHQWNGINRINESSLKVTWGFAAATLSHKYFQNSKF